MTQWFIGNQATGQITNYIMVTQGDWATALNDDGSISGTAPLFSPIIANLNLRSAAAVGQSFLGCSENGVIMNAGPIWSHDYDRDAATLGLDAVGFGSIFAKRTALPVVPAGVTSPAGLDTNLTNLDSGTIAKRILQQALLEPGGSLPIVFQDDVAGTSGVQLSGADLGTISDAIDDLISSGIDVQFEPQFTSDGQGVQWLLRTGTDSIPQIASAQSQVWDMSVPRASVKGLKVKVDGSQLAGRVWETTGSDPTSSYFARVDNASLINQGYPLLEAVDSTHTDVDDTTVLANFAKERARVGSRPTELWSFDVQAAAQPLVGSYKVGDWCVVKVGNDPYIPAGSYKRRITNLSGDQDGQWVSVTTGETYSLTG